ncbi:MAG: tRNA (N(6)-L-threonylcarbamoyladenosine(37)-C(2))-methylthiotransferase MtaB [Lachnospiraceae bacterium]|nr:tRNA (N(6)-L-threonylcarbamoyladenosine(37)-C(2))-methylthiotransferase MtaB [Lachnospiraceae bacterium]
MAGRKPEDRKRAALHNLGCKVNAYETEAMEQLLREAGYVIVPFDETADVYVINTCSVTNIADRKSRQMLHRARKMNPSAVVVAAGCYVQTANDRTHLEVDADVIIGNNKKKELPQILETFFRERAEAGSAGADEGRQRHILDINHEGSYEELKIDRTSEHTRAFIKVQDGCNQFCSYCIIPFARGRIRSRQIPDVVEEVGKLTASGVKEIVLTGIHLSSYGMDWKESPSAGSLLSLIRSVACVPGVERIRLGSLEPRIITEAFAAALKAVPQFCPHFHLSLQSGCDSVLRRMNRKYTTEEYEKALEILRTVFDDPALTTDVIVGFPGETEEEFACTRKFLEKIGLYETHIFKYSMRAGTRAAAMPDQVPEHVKNDRSSDLIALGRENMRRYIRRWDRKPVQVLVEETRVMDGETWYTGYTREYIRVFMKDEAGDGESRVNTLVTGCLDCLRPERILLCEHTEQIYGYRKGTE